jgi:hypothetical protein
VGLARNSGQVPEEDEQRGAGYKFGQISALAGRRLNFDIRHQFADGKQVTSP